MISLHMTVGMIGLNATTRVLLYTTESFGGIVLFGFLELLFIGCLCTDIGIIVWGIDKMWCKDKYGRRKRCI